MESVSTAGLDPSSQTPPDLSDGTPVYLYAVICSSDRCSQPDANLSYTGTVVWYIHTHVKQANGQYRANVGTALQQINRNY